MRIRKGDRVRVLQGKDKGKVGEVMRVIPKTEQVIVEGVNIAKRHQRPTRTTMQGGIIDKDMPIHISSVARICSHCGPTRVGFRYDDQGRKIRVCKKCGGEL
jgi:large subunit ribosomal protein L24